MFFARPISLKTEVWDRIDAYMNEYATTHRDFTPNRSAFIEECIIAYLDAKDAEASGASSDTDTSLDDLGLDTESTGDTDTDESTGDTSSEETSDDSGLDADAADEDAAAEAS